jgi:hypothetical protein
MVTLFLSIYNIYQPIILLSVAYLSSERTCYYVLSSKNCRSKHIPFLTVLDTVQEPKRETSTVRKLAGQHISESTPVFLEIRDAQLSITILYMRKKQSGNGYLCWWGQKTKNDILFARHFVKHLQYHTS